MGPGPWACSPDSYTLYIPCLGEQQSGEAQQLWHTLNGTRYTFATRSFVQSNRRDVGKDAMQGRHRWFGRMMRRKAFCVVCGMQDMHRDLELFCMYPQNSTIDCVVFCTSHQQKVTVIFCSVLSVSTTRHNEPGAVPTTQRLFATASAVEMNHTAKPIRGVLGSIRGNAMGFPAADPRTKVTGEPGKPGEMRARPIDGIFSRSWPGVS